MLSPTCCANALSRQHIWVGYHGLGEVRGLQLYLADGTPGAIMSHVVADQTQRSDRSR